MIKQQPALTVDSLIKFSYKKSSRSRRKTFRPPKTRKISTMTTHRQPKGSAMLKKDDSSSFRPTRTTPYRATRPLTRKNITINFTTTNITKRRPPAKRLTQKQWKTSLKSHLLQIQRILFRQKNIFISRNALTICSKKRRTTKNVWAAVVVILKSGLMATIWFVPKIWPINWSGTQAPRRILPRLVRLLTRRGTRPQRTALSKSP